MARKVFEVLNRTCPVCEASRDHQIIYRKWGYPILRCGECGLGSTDVPDQFDPAEIYTQDYFQGEAKDGYADYISSEAVLRREFRHTLTHLRGVAPHAGRLLEIGCAYGFFLQEAEPYYKCVGVDVAREAVEFARRRGLEAHHGIADEQFLRNTGPFELVVMLDVIEHLPEPAKVLAALRDAVTEGGHLVITTGDWDSVMARLTGRHWRLLTPPQHLYFFSRPTLTAMLKRVGFEVVELRRPWKLVPIGLAVYQLARLFRITLPRSSWLNRLGVPLNLFDAFLVIARKT